MQLIGTSSIPGQKLRKKKSFLFYEPVHSAVKGKDGPLLIPVEEIPLTSQQSEHK